MIRTATRFDKPELFQMLRNYRDSGSIFGVQGIDNEPYIDSLLSHIMAGAGQVLVAEKNNKIIGMFIAIKTPFIWDNDYFSINELAFWVEPEHRGGTAGYRLLKQYVDTCVALKNEGKIKNFTVSRRAGTKLDYSKFGFQAVDENWSQ
jgi:N-acetylglutamate synthase-like GNAT family acetyltransferase